MIKPLGIKLDDEASERVRKSHHAVLEQLQAMPVVSERVISAVSLADSTPVYISHGLGRTPTFYALTAPQGATSTGRIVETRDGIDRTKFLVLTATGWGATITVDVAVK